MLKEDIKRIMELDPASARGRNKDNGREIKLDAPPHEVVNNAEHRASLYRDIADNLKWEVQDHRHGIMGDELERIEFIREQLYRLSVDVYALTLNR